MYLNNAHHTQPIHIHSPLSSTPSTTPTPLSPMLPHSTSTSTPPSTTCTQCCVTGAFHYRASRGLFTSLSEVLCAFPGLWVISTSLTNTLRILCSLSRRRGGEFSWVKLALNRCLRILFSLNVQKTPDKLNGGVYLFSQTCYTRCALKDKTNIFNKINLWIMNCVIQRHILGSCLVMAVW